MEIAESIFHALEIIGTIAFAISGAMIAIERRLDLFGVIFLGVITAVGGGIIRDMLIGRFPPAAFVNKEFVFVAIFTAALIFAAAYFAGKVYFKKAALLDTVNNIFDALGLGAFAVSGAMTGAAVGYGDNAFMCIFLGMLTGVGGGLLRDMMSLCVPFVLRKRIYAIAAITGAATYYYLNRLELHNAVSIFAGVGITVIIRILATVFKWNLPVAKGDAEDKTVLSRR